MFRKVLLAVAAGLLAIPMARADSIVIEGEVLENVIVREGGSFYYVQIPETGEIRTVRTSEAGPEDVRISDDSFHRDELVAEWEQNRGVERETEAASASEAEWSLDDSASDETSRIVITNNNRPAPPRMTRVSGGSGPMAAIEIDGYVRRIGLEDVPLRQALSAILRTQNLDYAVEEGFIWVSTPERIRHESFEDLETRVYELAASGETLPKIVVHNPGGVMGTHAFGIGGMGGTLGGMGTLQGMGSMGGIGGGTGTYGGGFGGQTGGFGTQTGGFGTQRGGFGTQRGGFGTQRGGFGTQRGGFGGMGGGFGGSHFSNISQLFNSGPQYDLLVGESPAVIMPMSRTFVEGPPRGRFLGFTDLGGARGVAPGAARWDEQWSPQQQWNQRQRTPQRQWDGPGGIGRAGAYDYY